MLIERFSGMYALGRSVYSDFCKRTNYHVACTRVRLLCTVRLYGCATANGVGFDSTSSSPFLAAAAVTRIYCSKAKVPCYIPHATCDLLDAMPCARMRVCALHRVALCCCVGVRGTRRTERASWAYLYPYGTTPEMCRLSYIRRAKTSTEERLYATPLDHAL